MAAISPSPPPEPSAGPTLLQVCVTALWLGTISYGGPAILEQMKKTLAGEKRWISEKEFLDALSLAQILPGAIAVSTIGYIGHKLRKPWGAILMPACYVLPAAALITAASWMYFRYQNIRVVQSLFVGMGAMVVALMVNATLQLGRSVFKKGVPPDYKGLLIAICTFSGLYFGRVNVIWLTVAAGLLGLLLYRSGDASPDLPSTPPRVAGGGRRKQLVPLAALSVTAVAVLSITRLRGIFTTFFTIGMVAFGGGMAAIPVIQGKVVDQLGWLSLSQFRDGIALGQITPGPVYITATFIGYKMLGVIGALVATIAVFMPSLAAMIALSEVHSAVRHMKPIMALVRGFQVGFIGFLAAITVQFAMQSLAGWQTWLIFCGSAVLMLYYKKDALWAIAGSIVVSLVLFH